MPRREPDQEPPDRLSAVLEELDAVRTKPTWTPQEDSIADPRAGLRERFSGGRRDAHPGGPGRHHAGALGDQVIRPHTPLVRAPMSLRDARVAPSRLALVGVLAVLVVAGAILGGRVLMARATAAPHPIASHPHSTAATPHPSGALSAASTPAATDRSRQSTAATVVVVQVVGQVRHPGVVTLHSGARVEDAVEAAGGATTSADLTRVNLARKVVDGEQIQVPKPGEAVTPPPAAAAPDPGASASGTTAVVDLNTADEAALEELPGIGPVLAARIVEWRQQNGQFTSVDELAEVSGIGDKMLQQLRSHVRV